MLTSVSNWLQLDVKAVVSNLKVVSCIIYSRPSDVCQHLTCQQLLNIATSTLLYIANHSGVVISIMIPVNNSYLLILKRCICCMIILHTVSVLLCLHMLHVMHGNEISLKRVEDAYTSCIIIFKYCTAEIFTGRNFIQFCHLLSLVKILSMNFFSCMVKIAYWIIMVTFTALAKVLSLENYYNKR